jgi:hypothetical protein
MSHMLSPKLKQVSAFIMAFYCPGCKEEHQVMINQKNDNGNSWSWNCSIKDPTFTPFIEIKKEIHCHVTVEDGRLRFSPDCQHQCFGEDLEMVDFPVELLPEV